MKISRLLTVLLTLFTVVALSPISGCGSDGASSSAKKIPSNGLIQTSSGGQVTIDVTWNGLKNGSLVFEVAMNTHSVNLDGYDLMSLSMLEDSSGNIYSPSGADMPPGGHHRRGVLTFPVPDPSRLLSAEYVDLKLKGIAGVPERDLRWQLN